MFKTGEATPANVVGSLLNALQGYRISFYSVKDSNFSMYVVSRSTKKHIIKNLIVPRSKYMALLGSCDKRDVIERAKSALSDRLRLKGEKKAAPLDEPKIGYVKNKATGRMIKVGSRRYKELFPDAKKAIGCPKKKWDPVVDLMEIAKKLDNLDGKNIKNVVNAISNRTVKLTFSNGKVFEFLVKRRKDFLQNYLQKGCLRTTSLTLWLVKNQTPSIRHL